MRKREAALEGMTLAAVSTIISKRRECVTGEAISPAAAARVRASLSSSAKRSSASFRLRREISSCARASASSLALSSASMI
jgi:hypothetical protein